MSSLEFSKLVSNPVDLIPSQKTKIFVSTAYDRITGEKPEMATISVVSPNLSADGVLTANLSSDIPVTLYEGTRFVFALTEAEVAASNKVFYLSQQLDFTGGANITITTGGAIAQGAVLISLSSSSPISFPTGATLTFGSVTITLNEPVSLTATSTAFDILAAPSAVPAGSTTTVASAGPAIPGVKLEAKTGATVPTGADKAFLVSYIPFFSANSINISDNGEQIEDNIFSGGFNMEKAMIGLNQSAEMSGPRVIGDPGYEELGICRNTGKVVDVMVVYPFRTGGESFTAICTELSRNSERGAFQQVSATLGITGSITEFK